MSSYLAKCPDCIPLPAAFPLSCAKELLIEAKNLATGNGLADPKCALHCAITVGAWAGGLYIGDEHVHLGDRLVGDTPAAGEAALQDLVDGKKMAGKIPWLSIALFVAEFLKSLLNK